MAPALCLFHYITKIKFVLLNLHQLKIFNNSKYCFNSKGPFIRGLKKYIEIWVCCHKLFYQQLIVISPFSSKVQGTSSSIKSTLSFISLYTASETSSVLI